MLLIRSLIYLATLIQSCTRSSMLQHSTLQFSLNAFFEYGYYSDTLAFPISVHNTQKESGRVSERELRWNSPSKWKCSSCVKLLFMVMVQLSECYSFHSLWIVLLSTQKFKVFIGFGPTDNLIGAFHYIFFKYYFSDKLFF